MDLYLKIVAASILTLIFLGGLVGLVYATSIIYSHILKLKKLFKNK